MQRRRYFHFFAFFIAALSPATCAHAREPLRQRLDALVPSVLREQGVASVSLARVERGRIALVAAWGEQSAGVAATPRSLYNLASLTKPVSAETILRLAARGEVDLDEAMADAYTDPDLASDPQRLALTPRLALSHRSGLPNWRRETGGVLRFVHAPGTQFGYSGEGYEYLAHFAAAKTRTPFDALMRRLVLRPAHADDMGYALNAEQRARVAVPHGQDGTPLPAHFADDSLASDLLYASAEDYARFLVALIRREGLSPALAHERERVQTDRSAELCPPQRRPDCPLQAGMGLGWEVFAFADGPVLMHTGKDEGLFTFAYFAPARGSGVVLLTNSENGAKAVLPILDAIAADPAFLRFLHRLAE